MKKLLSLFCAALVLLTCTLQAFATEFSGYKAQLSAMEAEIYNSILQNLTDRKSAFSYSFPTPPEFEGDQANAVKEMEKAAVRAYEAFYREHPEVFWVVKSAGIKFSAIIQPSGASQKVTQLDMTTQFFEEAKIPEKRNALNQAVDALAAKATGSDYEKLKTIHDGITAKCEYDMDARQNPSGYPDAFEAYGALVSGKAVCEGYSKAFKLLCDKLGIPCVLVIGQAEGPHMWNYVQLDGAWYLVDCTFDDPVGGKPGYDYFLKGADSTKDHRPSGDFMKDFSSDFTDPELSKTDYDKGKGGASAKAEKAAKKASCKVRYSGTEGGRCVVTFVGVPGALDNGQTVPGGTVLQVSALANPGYEFAELKIIIGDQTTLEQEKRRVKVEVLDDCTITAKFKRKSAS